MPADSLLIGLDGFDPDLANQWIDSGDLPTLKRVKENGCFAPLNSTVPPFTYPAWSDLLTGVNPGKHGIIDFAQRKYGSYHLNFINSSYRQSPTIFQLLSSEGENVGAMGFPTTYPPDTINGFMISGFDCPIAVNANPTFCYPEALYYELKRNVSRYTLTGFQELRIGKKWHFNALKNMLRTIDDRTNIARYLLEKDDYRLFGIVFSESDTVAHHFWSFYDHASPRYIPSINELEDGILTIYKRLDKAVSQLLEKTDSESTIIIVSDHGSGGTGKDAISINRMLNKSGYLNFSHSSQKKNRIKSFFNPKQITQYIPVKIQEFLFRKNEAKFPAQIEAQNRIRHIDLDNSVAFSDELNYFPSIWLHDQRFPKGHHFTGHERSQVLTAVQSSMKKITNPESGDFIFKDVLFREDLYFGKHVDAFPDIILLPALNKGYSYPIQRANSPGNYIFEIPQDAYIGKKGASMNGSHREKGIFLAMGPKIPNLKNPGNIKLRDITPTILTILNYETPDWMDGRIISEIIENKDSDIDHLNPLKSRSNISRRTDDLSADEQKELEKKLKDLGYL